MKFVCVALFLAVTASGCSGTDSGPVAGADDALAQEACAESEHEGDAIQSVLDADEAIEHALVHAGEPVTVELAGPTSYVAVEVPNHHSDYGIFTDPAGVLKGTSTTTLSEEAINGACPNEGLGDNRLHIHEFDHSVLTLEGSGTVWLYFGQDGGGGHGGHGGAGGHGGHGGAGGHGGHVAGHAN